MGWVWLTRSCYETLWLAPSLESEVKRLKDSQDWLGRVRLAEPDGIDSYKMRETKDDPYDREIEVPHYSTNPADSKLLRDKLAEKWDLGLLYIDSAGGYVFAIYHRGGDVAIWEVFSDTEELAVVLCALRSAGIEVSQ